MAELNQASRRPPWDSATATSPSPRRRPRASYPDRRGPSGTGPGRTSPQQRVGHHDPGGSVEPAYGARSPRFTSHRASARVDNGNARLSHRAELRCSAPAATATFERGSHSARYLRHPTARLCLHPLVRRSHRPRMVASLQPHPRANRPRSVSHWRADTRRSRPGTDTERQPGPRYCRA